MENGDFTCNDTATLAMFAAMQVSAKLNTNKGRPSRGAVPGSVSMFVGHQ